jgi:peptidoglycan/LPS O-acetylase OafA/YrhL
MSLSTLPVILAIGLAFFAAFAVARPDPAGGQQGRVSSIDGLRGYLAFAVFLCHGSVWYYYLHTGTWTVPPSNVFAHLGQSSVAMFFMITGFLFFSKLLASRATGMDWTKLYVSRVLRLTPLYLVAVGLVFFIVFVLSGAKLQVPSGDLLSQLGAWLGFTILGMPNINGVPATFSIIAGVPWSLPYEWLFYCSLPLIALTLRIRVSWPVVLMALIVVVGFFLAYDKMYSMILFPAGMATAVLVRHDAFRKFAVSRIASVVVLSCVACAVSFYPSAHGAVPLLLLSISFALIAGGNSLFGALTHRVSRSFGDTAYSIYLLHGILLFLAIHFVVGVEAARAFTPAEHWFMMLVLTPILVLTSHFSYWYIEHPCMLATSRVTAALRRYRRPVVPTAVL